ncbi:hypothetical protein GIB67_005926, partial [Kingdonia uniflora]
MRVITNAQCPMCGDSIETASHLFMECLVAKVLWGAITSKCNMVKQIGNFEDEVLWIKSLNHKELLAKILKTVLLQWFTMFGNRNDKIVYMLRNSFLSEMPLTEVLLSNHASETPPALKFMSNNITESKAKRKDTASVETTKIVFKLTISTAKNKIMHVKAGKDFVAFLFSLLTFPLGSVVKLLDLSNLYKTVEGPNLAEHMRSDRKASLLSPMVAPCF